MRTREKNRSPPLRAFLVTRMVTVTVAVLLCHTSSLPTKAPTFAFAYAYAFTSGHGPKSSLKNGQAGRVANGNVNGNGKQMIVTSAWHSPNFSTDASLHSGSNHAMMKQISSRTCAQNRSRSCTTHGTALQASREANQENGPENSASSPLVRLALSPIGAVVVLSFVVLFHEMGHYLAAKSLGAQVDEFSVGLGPKLAGWQLFGGDAFNLRALPLGGFVSVNTDSLAELPWQGRVGIMSAGVVFNMILATIIYTGQILVGDGLPVSVFEAGIAVGGFDKEKGAAAKGQLRQGDIIVAVNGKPMLPKSTTSEMEVQRAIGKLIDQVQKTPDGQYVTFSVKKAKSSKVQQVQIQPKRPEGDPNGKPSVGIFLVPNFSGIETKQTDQPIQAAVWGAGQVASFSKETAIGLATLARDFVTRKSGDDSPAYSFSGPVGVIKRASRVVETKDWDKITKYAAALSVNLGVVNCLPVPPLDGFQVVSTVASALWNHGATN